jgi:ankyrin repeat protein
VSPTTHLESMLLFLLSSLALRAPPHMVSRRSVIVTTVLSPTAVSAFDLPPPDGLVAAFNPYDIKALEDPNVRSKFAAAPNPDKARQQSSAYFAVSNGDIDSLQAMADGGWALAELADDNGKTLLHRAAQIGNEPAVKLLLKMSSPIDAYTSFKETPLHLAVRNNHLECVKLLVDAGASMSALYSTNGDTALTLAKKYKFADVFEYLKSKGAA